MYNYIALNYYLAEKQDLNDIYPPYSLSGD